ncbi:hypothetical protein COO60DRAFT_689851 [Scenedesmus sp. NREL 46B-D3]|nr:hypothetical protein COO60DRAFT_689851 [Scenedesmus sp. NREL 46B-D3]
MFIFWDELDQAYERGFRGGQGPDHSALRKSSVRSSCRSLGFLLLAKRNRRTISFLGSNCLRRSSSGSSGDVDSPCPAPAQSSLQPGTPELLLDEPCGAADEAGGIIAAGADDEECISHTGSPAAAAAAAAGSHSSSSADLAAANVGFNVTAGTAEQEQPAEQRFVFFNDDISNSSSTSSSASSNFWKIQMLAERKKIRDLRAAMKALERERDQAHHHAAKMQQERDQARHHAAKMQQERDALRDLTAAYIAGSHLAVSDRNRQQQQQQLVMPCSSSSSSDACSSRLADAAAKLAASDELPRSNAAFLVAGDEPQLQPLQWGTSSSSSGTISRWNSSSADNLPSVTCQQQQQQQQNELGNSRVLLQFSSQQVPAVCTSTWAATGRNAARTTAVHTSLAAAAAGAKGARTTAVLTSTAAAAAAGRKAARPVLAAAGTGSVAPSLASKKAAAGVRNPHRTWIPC